jgi:hypothetical protein
MLNRIGISLLISMFAAHGCSGPGSAANEPMRHRATGDSPQVIALYEAWFGHPKHISVGYSSHDPSVISKQIREAKRMGISAFVVDWYGDREPFIDASYAAMQKTAAKEKFRVAMMYDETNQEDGATDEAIADFTMFHESYLSANAPGHEAYLTYEGRPVIFIFPTAGHTDWDKVRAVVNKWSPAPLLIQENLPDQYADAFDGFYAWINPGNKGWSADGSNWGEQYLSSFYQTMLSKFPDKIIVGGAWSTFDDSKASWGLNRHISARCGQTFRDTLNFWRKDFPSDDPPPFIMVETWNDYEEGTAIERGIPTCDGTNKASNPKSRGRWANNTENYFDSRFDPIPYCAFSRAQNEEAYLA